MAPVRVVCAVALSLSLVPVATLAQPAPPATPARPRAGSSPTAGSPPFDMARPIAARPTVFIEDMTWMEVRDAMAAGKKTVILASGGIEMNGPYLVAGKHNIVLRATTAAIARQLGNALVAPIVGFVPEGNIDPPSGMMRYPSTVGISEDTFKRLLTDIANGLRVHGFEHIVMIADSGGNVNGMKAVAADLTAAWAGKNTTIHYIAEYYDYPALTTWLESQALVEVDEGHHDDLGITALMMVTDPSSVRMDERLAAGRFSINGINLAPADTTIALGRRAAEWRAEQAVKAIRKVIPTP